jgi:hypothetical protein
MKKNSSIRMCVVVAVFYFGLTGSMLAIPAPPTQVVPDTASTGLLLAAAISGVGFLKWKLRR